MTRKRKCNFQIVILKKFLFVLTVFITIIASSCNNSSDSNSNNARTRPKSKVDSLMDNIMADHGTGMAKMNKISVVQGQIRKIIDSIGKLPVKERNALASYKTDLDSLFSRLQNAEDRMNQWMDEFNMDSLENDAEKRVQYLSSENQKTTRLKDDMVSLLQKADSLLSKNKQ